MKFDTHAKALQFRPSMVAILFVLICPLVEAAQTQEVSFKSGDVTLSGTLFIPKGDGPFPAVVFIHGSGPETRKNSKYSAKWFAANGYAALTYDKRGTGKSGGDPTEYTYFSFENLANDVIAGVDYLSHQSFIDHEKIGVHATSQGGWVAALADAKCDLIRFMIIKSASVCTVAEDRIFERAKRLEREGFSKTDLDEVLEIQKTEPMEQVENLQSRFNQLFEKYRNKPWFDRVYPVDDVNDEGLVRYRTWYATVAPFDPLNYLRQSTSKAFWIFGDPELDHLGPVSLSIQNLKHLIESGKEYQIRQYDGEGHNVAEKKYEIELYNWLSQIHGPTSFKFKKH